MKPWIIAIMWIALPACGAPTSSPNQVGDIFLSDQSLGAREGDLCAYLGAQASEPNLNLLSLSPQDCQSAGSRSLDLQDLLNGTETADLSAFDTSTSQARTPDETLKVDLRAEVWLGSSLTGLVQYGPMLQPLLSATGASSATPTDPDGSIVLIDSDAKPLPPPFPVGAHLKATLSKAPSFDQATGILDGGELTLAFNIGSTLTINQVFAITGEIHDDAIVLSIVTPQAAPSSQSLIETAKVLVMVVPYAQDVYVDAVSSMQLYSFGLSPLIAAAMKSGINGLLQRGLSSLKNGG